MSDIRTKTLAEICELVSPLVPGAAVRVTRKDRHDERSTIMVVIVETESEVGFMKLTEVAGVFETPTITITPEVEPDGTFEPSPMLRIRITWDASHEHG